MLCPVCNDEEMLILEYNDVEIDYCNECSGIWLDEGELELLGTLETDSPVIKALISKSDSPEKTDRPCPVCTKRMHLVKIPLPSGDGKEVEIDKCPRNHGLWFDNGELQDIISAAKGEPVAEFLADLFSK
jgi:Zn-finger nucleic acid-binding protein